MDNTDKNAFKELFNGLNDYYQSKERISTVALQIYFGALERFTFEQVTNAVTAHVSDPTSGKFYPKAGDLIKHLEGVEITADMILAAAKLERTPLGILASIHIGSWDLRCQDNYYLMGRAKECLQLLPDWQERASRGDYTDHEISIMLKHSVNPLQPFSSGIVGPQSTLQLETRARDILGSDKFKSLVEGNSSSMDSSPNLEQLKVIHGAIAKMEPVKQIELDKGE